jgi:hypothetical protein
VCVFAFVHMRVCVCAVGRSMCVGFWVLVSKTYQKTLLNTDANPPQPPGDAPRRSPR